MSLTAAQNYFVQQAIDFYYEMAAAGVPIQFHLYYRSPQEQNELYDNGVTKARAYESPHQYGLAADYHFQGYGFDVPHSWWAFADRVARGFNLETGIHWSDANHLQLPGWKQWKHGYSSLVAA